MAAKQHPTRFTPFFPCADTNSITGGVQNQNEDRLFCPSENHNDVPSSSVSDGEGQDSQQPDFNPLPKPPSRRRIVVGNERMIIFFLTFLTMRSIAMSLFTNNEEETKEFPMPFSPKESFDWNKLDIQIGGICGADKCFFLEKDDNRFGYLVTINTGWDRSCKIEEGWRLSQYLQDKFGIRHFLSESPERRNVTATAAALLSANLRDTNKDKPILPNSKFVIGNHVLIQKVTVAPPILLVKASSWEAAVLKVETKNFTTDVQRFARNLERETRSLLELVVSVPLFAIDFQVMIDQEGNIHHLDFDRSFSAIFRDELSFARQFQSSFVRTMEFIQKMASWADSKMEGNGTSSPLHRETAFSKDSSFDLLLKPRLNWEEIASMERFNELELQCQNITAKKAKSHVKSLRYKGGKVNKLAYTAMVDLTQREMLFGIGEDVASLKNCSVGRNLTKY